RMLVGLVERFDHRLDLVVRGALVLQLPGEDRLVLADPAAGAMLRREAGEERLVVLARALLALTEAVDEIEGLRISARDLVGLADVRVVPVGEPARVDDRPTLD